MINEKRTPQFKKNNNLESLLQSINTHIKPLNHDKSYLKDGHKVIFIIGPPRSGTTLLSQWLSGLNLFCYPTNFMSRFFKNPVLGAQVQQLLFDERFRYKKEFEDVTPHLSSYRSQLGKTEGVLSPNEFWYFWKRFYDFPEIPQVFNRDSIDFNYKGFFSELSQVASVFDKPIFLKALIINETFPYFLRHNPNAIVVHIFRNEFDNAVSLMNARKSFFGNYDDWYSFKTSNYNELKELEPFDQVQQQIRFTNNAIITNLQEFSDERFVSVSYEKFCNNPAELYTHLVEKLKIGNCSPYQGVSKFEVKTYNRNTTNFN